MWLLRAILPPLGILLVSSGCVSRPPPRPTEPAPAQTVRASEPATAEPTPAPEPPASEVPEEPLARQDPEDAGAPEAPAQPEEPQPFHQPLPPFALPADSLAVKHANLSPSACRQEVARRKLPVKRDGRPTPGVATALRFTGPLNGVRFLTAGWKSPFGVMDCRLVLAFEAMADVLHEHGVAQVNVGTMYRRGSKLQSRKPSQYAHALAADIVGFRLEDGRELVIERDFAGELGAPVCGPETRLSEPTAEAVALRNLVCDLARRQLFHYMLTPNYDGAHHDHLHVDIIRNGKRGVIR